MIFIGLYNEVILKNKKIFNLYLRLIKKDHAVGLFNDFIS